MVFSNGKPYWVRTGYIVQSVVGKNPAKQNKWHPRLIGKRCGIDILELRRTGHLWIEGLVEWEEHSPFYTSPVANITVSDDGTVIFETENSVYTLVPTKKEV